MALKFIHISTLCCTIQVASEELINEISGGHLSKNSTKALYFSVLFTRCLLGMWLLLSGIMHIYSTELHCTSVQGYPLFAGNLATLTEEGGELIQVHPEERALLHIRRMFRTRSIAKLLQRLRSSCHSRIDQLAEQLKRQFGIPRQIATL